MTKIYEVVVKNPKITSGYGKRVHPIYKDIRMHNGIDLVSKDKDRNLYAFADGYVQKIVTGQDKSKTGYGNYIWVRYPSYDLSLLYAHCEKVYLKKGDKVTKGTVVAKMGQTGAATGVHLHLGMTRIGKSAWLNPTEYSIKTNDKFNLTRLLQRGCKGNDVKELQIKVGATADGIFGDKTKAKVKAFQKSHKLTQDGKVGKNTAHALGWLYQGK